MTTTRATTTVSVVRPERPSDLSARELAFQVRQLRNWQRDNERPATGHQAQVNFDRNAKAVDYRARVLVREQTRRAA